METTTKKLANMDELLIAATDWLAPRCKKDADIAGAVRQLADVCDAVQNERDVFLLCVKEPANYDKGANHYVLLSVCGKGKVNMFWPGEVAYKAFGYGKTRRTSNMVAYAMQSVAIGMSRALDATQMVQKAINDVLKAAGSTEQLQQLSSSRF